MCERHSITYEFDTKEECDRFEEQADRLVYLITGEHPIEVED